MNNSFYERLLFEDSIGKCAKALVYGVKNAPDIALKEILRVSEASRIYIFENFQTEDGDLCMHHIYEKCAEGVKPQIDSEDIKVVSYKKNGFSRWEDKLSRRKIIYGDVENFPKSERKKLEPQNIKSILVIPLFVKNKWFGFIGFDYIEKVKRLSDVDLSLLSITADLFVSYFTNLSNIQKIEQQNTQLKYFLKSKDRFLQMLAHDLRNSLLSTIMLTDYLTDELGGDKLSRYYDTIQMINKSTQDTHDLLEELLLWSKEQTNSLQLDLVELNIKEICINIIKVLELNLDSKNISVELISEDNIMAMVDEMVLKIVFRNLLINAIKFSNEGSKIIVSIFKNNGNIKIDVKDEGVGINKEIIDDF